MEPRFVVLTQWWSRCPVLDKSNRISAQVFRRTPAVAVGTAGLGPVAGTKRFKPLRKGSTTAGAVLKVSLPQPGTSTSTAHTAPSARFDVQVVT